MRLTPILCLVALACTTPKHPTGTLHVDEALFATASETGWTHVSGETALTVQDGSVDIHGRLFPVDDVVTCDATTCSQTVTARDVSITDDQIVVSGVVRGTLTDANALGRKTALVAIMQYTPPGGVWATSEFNSERVKLGAMPDGRLVLGDVCRWPTDCRDLHTIGHWSEYTLTVNGAEHAMADVVEVTDDAVFTRPSPGVPPYFRMRAQEGEGGRYDDYRIRELHLDFGRRKDASSVSGIAKAAMGALTIHFDQLARALPPPPPPPPDAP